MMEDALLDSGVKLTRGHLSRDLNEMREWGTGVLG